MPLHAVGKCNKCWRAQVLGVTRSHWQWEWHCDTDRRPRCPQQTTFRPFATTRNFTHLRDDTTLQFWPTQARSLSLSKLCHLAVLVGRETVGIRFLTWAWPGIWGTCIDSIARVKSSMSIVSSLFASSRWKRSWRFFLSASESSTDVLWLSSDDIVYYSGQSVCVPTLFHEKPHVVGSQLLWRKRLIG